eukprot:gene4492-78_t
MKVNNGKLVEANQACANPVIGCSLSHRGRCVTESLWRALRCTGEEFEERFGRVERAKECEGVRRSGGNCKEERMKIEFPGGVGSGYATAPTKDLLT